MTPEFLWAVLGFAGGAARELDMWLRKKTVFSPARVFVHGLISTFCGYLGAIVCDPFYPGLSSAAAGFCGWLGPESFTIGLNMLHRYRGKNEN